MFMARKLKVVGDIPEIRLNGLRKIIKNPNISANTERTI
jgi:hypothetical protein